ncbi:hypothetical protein, conserved [Eimeria brunetti]|uniref:Uncharacterized protein n=1 Tax=Eimeria brunetti TaxID=51314 RepID=U6LAP3_9EIME|nr:hypothetical protein, conserved [Eimeria brunetti]
MEVIWLLKEQPISWHKSTNHLHLDIQAGSLNKDAKDAFPRSSSRPCTALAQKALPLLAAFASVAVVVFLAYLCGFLIRRSIYTSSWRKLTPSSGGEESDGSGSCVTSTNEVGGASQDFQSHHTPSPMMSPPAKPGRDEPEERDLTAPLLKGTAAFPTTRARHAASRQLATPGKEKRVKRKRRGNASVQKKAKLFRVEESIQEIMSEPPPPALEPHFDTHIDSVLHEIEAASLDASWIVDDEPAHLVSSALQNKRAPSKEESGGQRNLSARTLTGQPAKLSGDLPALDGNDLTITTRSYASESTLLEAHDSSQGLSPDDWLSGSEAEVEDEALRVMAFTETHPALPGNTQDPKETAKSHWPLSDVAPKGRMDPRDLFSSEIPQGDSARQAVQVEL